MVGLSSKTEELEDSCQYSLIDYCCKIMPVVICDDAKCGNYDCGLVYSILQQVIPGKIKLSITSALENISQLVR